MARNKSSCAGLTRVDGENQLLGSCLCLTRVHTQTVVKQQPKASTAVCTGDSSTWDGEAGGPPSEQSQLGLQCFPTVQTRSQQVKQVNSSVTQKVSCRLPVSPNYCETPLASWHMVLTCLKTSHPQFPGPSLLPAS